MLNALENHVLYTPATIARFAEEKNLLDSFIEQGVERECILRRIRISMIRLRANNAGKFGPLDGLISLSGQGDLSAWYGWRWKDIPRPEMGNIKDIDPDWDTNFLLKQKGLFILSEVVRKLPFSTSTLVFQGKKNKLMGIWKNTKLGVYVVDMALFGPFITKLWIRLKKTGLMFPDEGKPGDPVLMEKK